jgi:hypothetical protein
MTAAPPPAQPLPPAPTLPEADHPQVAEALRQVADLDDRPLAEHHDRLSRAHEVLHGVLHPDPGAG